MRFLDRLATSMLLNPPKGLDVDYVAHFFRRQGAALDLMLAEMAQEAVSRGRPQPFQDSPWSWPTDPTSRNTRGALNVKAMRLLNAVELPLTPAERYIVGLYSGWGGLNLKPWQGQFPQGFPVPEARALLHEFYTPTWVWQRCAEVLLPMMQPGDRLRKALEPSAGIGRALRAFEGAGLAWTALEASETSCRLLEALFPDAEVVEGNAEAWAAQRIDTDRATFDLIAANPPYGARGAGMELDPNGYKTKQAYLYFLIRFSEFLKKRGVSAWIIPTGFLNSRTEAFARHRREFLTRAHLVAAFRMPSMAPKDEENPGIVYEAFPVDIIFAQGRGGIAQETSPDDASIIEGDYFGEHPDHVLGQVIGDASGDADAPSTTETGAKIRRGFQVVGTFRTFPAFAPRPFEDLPLKAQGKGKKTAFRGGIARAAIKDLAADQPPRLREAVALGARVDRFLADVAALKPAARAAQLELAGDLRSWRNRHGPPQADAGLRELAQAGNVAAQRFMAIWTTAGELPDVFNADLAVERGGYPGVPEITGFAPWWFRVTGGLPLQLDELIAEFMVQVPGARPLTPEAAAKALISIGWCLDGEEWDHIEPPDAYYTGFLWPKYDFAAKAVREERLNASAQLVKLRAAIGWTPASQIVAESAPNQPWIPFFILKAWAMMPYLDRDHWQPGLISGANWPGHLDFERADSLLTIRGVPYASLNNTDRNRNPADVDRTALSFLGWANGDRMLFTTPVVKEHDEAGNLVQIPREELQREMEKTWTEGWRAWLQSRDEVLGVLEEHYNRTLRGFVPPTFSAEPLVVPRWSSAIRLHGYQNEAVRKLFANGCGLLAFDVGLGKTYTAIQTIALMRQEGRARRPVVLVPNTIIWKWFRDFQRCLPDFRVLVVGSNRRQVKVKVQKANGEITSTTRWVARNDTPEERGKKWTAFQAGEYDVALVTYSAFGRQQMDERFVTDYVARTVAIRRSMILALEAAEDEKKEAGDEDEGSSKKKGAKRTERSEADLQERARAWVGEMLSPPKGHAYDTGIDWHALGVDALFVDEGQNFKNLFYSSREGAAERKAAKRAWMLDFRCASVRFHAGGRRGVSAGGIFILSATPMKNAATEFYNLLHLVNPDIWQQVGVEDPESFINQFARMQLKKQTLGSGKTAERVVVVGFNHADVLKNVVFRWATFKNAQQVGLKLPQVTRTQHIVRPTDAQQEVFFALFEELADLEERMKKMRAAANSGNKSFKRSLEAMKMKKQGITARLYLCALHPGLVGGSELPEAGPKLVECVTTILETRPEVCQIEPPPEERWITRPQLCDNKGEAGELEVCRTTENSWCLVCGHLVFAENVKVHYWLRELLVRGGIPRERIAILNAQEADDLELRQQIAEQFNGRGRPDGDDEYEPPAYDVLIANAVAYEGIDLQTRTCRVHHLDLPWEGATLQQRNGRAVRQGNRWSEIGVDFYLVRGSNEMQRLEKIERKRRIMLDLYSEGDLATNTVVADVLSDEEDVETAAAYLAFAPPALRARLEEMLEQERIEEEQRKDEQARKTAHEAVATGLAVLRRAVRAVERKARESAELMREGRRTIEQVLSQFPERLWGYPWRASVVAAQAAVEEGRDAGMFLPGGPAMIADARWRVTATEKAGAQRMNYLDFQVCAVDDEGIWIRRVANPYLEPLKLNDFALSYELSDWEPEWAPDVYEADQKRLERDGLHDLLAVEGDDWRRMGDILAEQRWVRLAGRLMNRKYPWQEPGKAPIPMVGGAGLGFWGDKGFEILDGRVIPRTWDGWRRFWGLVKAQRKMTLAQINAGARFWWGREIPTGLLGADFRDMAETEEALGQEVSG